MRSTFASLVALAACHAAAPPRPLPASEQASPAAVGNVVAIEEIGDTTVVLDESRAFVLRGGALASVTESPRGWLAGAAVAAPDGEGRWALGLDRDGRVWRISIAGELEDVTDRWKLSKVLAISGAALTSAFVLADGVAVTADGVHLARATLAPPTTIATGRGRIAMLGPHGVDAWDLARGTQVTFPVDGARAIAFVDATGDAPRLAVATAQRLFVENAGQLREVHVPAPIEDIAGSGKRLWLLLAGAGATDALVVLEGSSLRRAEQHLAHAAKPSSSLHLFGSPSGDVWLSTEGKLERVSIDRAGDDPVWLAQVAPVFQRVCSHCHLPGGEAGIDLSTPASWQGERAELVRRVLVTQTMPPAGTELSDADRSALAGWLNAK